LLDRQCPRPHEALSERRHRDIGRLTCPAGRAPLLLTNVLCVGSPKPMRNCRRRRRTVRLPTPKLLSAAESSVTIETIHHSNFASVRSPGPAEGRFQFKSNTPGYSLPVHVQLPLVLPFHPVDSPMFDQSMVTAYAIECVPAVFD
jgi:hypothetical protein